VDELKKWVKGKGAEKIRNGEVILGGLGLGVENSV